MRHAVRQNLGVIFIFLNQFMLSLVSSFVVANRKPLFRSHGRVLSLPSMPSTSTDIMPVNSTTVPLKVLALHGSGGTAEDFPNRLVALQEALAFHSDGRLELEITAIQAPFVKENGFSWWTMPPGVRSFNAEKYSGFEESATKVLRVWEKGGFDVVLGHSQGAILIGALLALKRTPYHPPLGYIMNGVSFPNPYSNELETLEEDASDTEDSPRILFLLGKRDQIAPNATGEKLRDLLGKGGYRVSSCYHDGGHGFPEEGVGSKTMETIAGWIQHCRRQNE